MQGRRRLEHPAHARHVSNNPQHCDVLECYRVVTMIINVQEPIMYTGKPSVPLPNETISHILRSKYRLDYKSVRFRQLNSDSMELTGCQYLVHIEHYP